MTTDPARGDVWTVNLDPVRGHEQAGTRPALVVSVDRFNRNHSDFYILVVQWRGCPQFLAHTLFG